MGSSSNGLTRRAALGTGAAAVSVLLVPRAQAALDMDGAIRAFVGEAPMKPGKVTMEVPPLVENGNAVPITISVESPMTTADYVKAIAIFNEKNPQPNVAEFRLGPRAGRAQVSSRIRLATSQTLTAVAELSDGTFWSTTADVVVTLAACVEE